MKNLFLCALFLAVILCTTFVDAAAAIRYVKPTATGTGTGNSWANASGDLQAMIDASAVGDEVWVATGTYKPGAYPTGCTGCSTTRDYAFLIKSGVSVYGGFAGTESAKDERNITANPTILSGDLNGNDVFDINNGGYQSGTGDDNCHHVVVMRAATSGHTSVFDGFLVTGGNADGTGNITFSSVNIPKNSGGGMYARNISGCTQTLTNNSFYNNMAGYGGGFYSLNFGSQTISNNAFYNNIVNNAGGGLDLTNYNTQIVDNNTSYNNRAVSGGGASIGNVSGSQTVTNNAIYNNAITGTGGGLSISNSNASGQQTITNNTIYNNTSTSNSGGLYTTNFGTQNISNNTIYNNTGSNTGGVTLSNSGTNAQQTFTHNTVFNNTATGSGGGLTTLNYGTTPQQTIANNAIFNNSAVGVGGGINMGGSSASSLQTIINNTIYNNTANSNGGGLYVSNSGTQNCHNNIFWANKKGANNNVAGADIHVQSGVTTFTHCLTQQNSTFSSGTGIINNQNPFFIDPANPAGADGIHRTADDGLRLSSCSPAINAGTSTGAPSTDIIGTSRPQFIEIDMGAYESTTNYSAPPTAGITNNTGTTVLTCITTSISVTATGGSSYAWSGGATPNTADNTFTTSGTYTVTVTNSGGCTATASVVVTNNDPTTANAGPNQSVSISSATMAANTPSFGSAEWSLVSGSGTITTPGSPTTTITNLGVGTNTFRWTIFNAPCTPSTDDVEITYSPAVNLVCPINNTVGSCQTQAAVDAAFANWLATASAGGGCDGVLTNNSSGAPSACGGSTTVTFTYTSTCGPLTTTCQATFTVAATTSPTPVFSNCTNNSVNLGCNPANLPSCTAITSGSFGGNVTASNSCGSVPVTCLAGEIIANGCNRTQVFTFEATACGQTVTCTRTFNWTVVTPPSFNGTCGNGVVNLGCNPLTLPSCNPDITASNQCGALPVTCNIGAITVNGCNRSQTITYIANASGCGTFSTCIRIFNWQETTAPVFANCDNTFDLGCNPATLPSCANVQTTPFGGAITATNECGNVSGITCSQGNIESDGCNRSQTFTFTLTGCGFTTTCTRTFTWSVDPTATLTCPNNTTTAAGQTQTAIDIAFNNWLASAGYSGGCGGVLSNNNTGAPSACGGSAMVTFTLDLPCQTDKTCQATFTVAELNAPTGTLSIVNSSCTACTVSGGSIAIGSVSGTGGTIEYSTNNGTNWSSSLPTYNQTGPPQTILASVLAANGCRSNAVQVGITAPGTCPPPPSASITGTTTGCNSVTLTASGGSGYVWSGGATPASASNTFTTSGSYTVTVTGSGGCTATASAVVTITPNTSNTTTINACDSYLWSVNGSTYNASGTYTSVSGCHTEILNLTITANTSNTTTINACGSYLWAVNGTTYNASGTYTSVSGCHTEILNLAITANTSNTTTINACGSYLWAVNGTTYNASGTYSSVSGCHTEILNLAITENTSNTTTINACGNYLWAVNGTTYNASGTYTSVSGCHTEILNLTITENTSNTTTISACGSYLWSVNGTTYNASGTYTSVSGCHTEILNLTITASTSNTTTITTCDSYLWSVNGTTYNASGTYSSVSGCHTEILNLTITENTSNTTIINACGSYLWAVNGTTYNASGTFTSVSGCHTEILNLTITENTSNTTTINACGNYLWAVNGTTYNASGTYTSVSGCHTEILNLTITANTSNTTTINTCGSYLWAVNGTTYNASGTFTSVSGCHTEILNLTITENTSNTTTINACGNYLWAVNGTTYNASGTYTSVSGCHTEILNLTITANTSNTTTINTCGSYLWAVNGTTYNTSGTYTSVSGCHTEILNLTITANTSNTTTINACGSYLWAVNGTTYNASGTYTSVNGCHTEILNLTITASTSNTTTITTCDSYLWSVNGTTYNASGTYTSVSGCHTEILNLTITGPCVDCLGEPGGLALPGTPCDDGNPETVNDLFGTDCTCAGTPVSTLCNLGATLNGTENLCTGGIIGLIATGGNMYQWSGPNGYTSSSGGSIIRTYANVNMSGTYTVTITNNTCVDVLSIVVTVHPIPSATLSGSSSICSGGTITLTAPAGSDSYQWSGPNGFSTNTGSSNTLVRTDVNTTMSGQYKVTVTNSGGCTATASRNVTVNAVTNAAVTPTATNTSFCSNTDVVFAATTSGVSYEWSGPGGFTANTAAISAPPVAGAYKVTVTNADGCISTATRNATIVAVPNAAITGNLNVCAGGKVLLMASGGNSYNWSGPGGFTHTGSNVLRNNATFAMSGTYTVTVTGSGGCKSTASVVVTVSACKNGEEQIALESLFAYPNPTGNLTIITFTALKAELMYLSIYAVDGREVAVLFNGMTEAETPYEFMFDANELPSGTYYAMLRRADGATQQLKLLVVR
ncbi:MAG: hypothetical protein IPM47_03205 [Sphingobacteriales bacterium]|nr:MAG: hypothetical protein IPM47_03205 [Sphingobacteriales bacterium]